MNASNRKQRRATALVVDTPDGPQLAWISDRISRTGPARLGGVAISAIAIALLLLGAAATFDAGSPTGANVVEAANPTDQVIVRFSSKASEQAVEALNASMAAQQVDAIPALGLRVLRVPPGQSAADFAERYAKNPLVEFAEPDFIAAVAAEPDDPLLGGGFQWALDRISASDAWGITQGSGGIQIAILDTGIDSSHPDLQGKVAASVNFSNSATEQDMYGHGTHVAGIAGASTNNGVGIAGVGFDSSLMNVKVMGDNGTGGYSWVTQGVIWATDNGADVINLSLGAQFGSTALEEAIHYATARGVLVVAAAGNMSSDAPFYPAAYPEVIAVASTDYYDRLAPGSNYGSWVDVAAPGGNIYSTLPGSRYGNMAGTSMASPHVAGVAALVFAIASDDNGDGSVIDEVRACIEDNADDIGIGGIGGGRLNAGTATACSGGPAAPVSAGDVAGTITDADNGSPIQGAVVAAGSSAATTNAAGQYLLKGLGTGQQMLNVDAADHLASHAVVNVAAGETTVADIALEPSSGSVSGVVIAGDNGAPIDGAQITVGAETATTDANGGFSLGPLEAGSHSLSVTAAGYDSETVSVAVAAGEETDVSIILNSEPVSQTLWVEDLAFQSTGKSLKLTATVSASAGAVAGAKVTVSLTHSDGTQWMLSGKTDSSGRVTFSPKKPPAKGTFTAEVTDVSAANFIWDDSEGTSTATFER